MPLHDRIFELLVDQVRDYAVFVLDPRGYIRSWNAGAQVIKGYPAEEIIGRHFSVFYPPDAVTSGWPASELRAAARDGRFEDEGWRIRRDGSQFWANVVITALRDEQGKLLGFSKFTRDLTSRQREQDALRQSEERFRLLVEGVTDYAIFMLDPVGRISSWNSGAQQITGYEREEVLGQHFSMFHTAEDVEAGRPLEELMQARRNGRFEDESWRLRKNGHRFRARVIVTALYDQTGQLRGFAKVTQDLSQREYTRGLEQAAKQVQEFVSLLAHELRNPLAPIRNAVQLIQRLPHDHPAHTKMVQTIDRQSAHMARILDDMLDIARVTRGELDVELAPLDLRQIVMRAADLARPAIEDAKQHLDLDLPSESVLVDGDMHRLTQVLGNVLANATRFTQEGGAIQVRLRRVDHTAEIRVRDNGRGIAPGRLESIFGMFVQGTDPIHRIGGGLGVGLGMARRLLAQHNGTIVAHSAGEGQGSEFTITLPLRTEATQRGECKQDADCRD